MDNFNSNKEKTDFRVSEREKFKTMEFNLLRLTRKFESNRMDWFKSPTIFLHDLQFNHYNSSIKKKGF